MTQEKYNPYCPICEACGEEGCCSAIACQQDPNGHYCKGYLQDLKFGYAMNRFVEREIAEHLPDELKDKYNKEWNEAYDAFYKIEE